MELADLEAVIALDRISFAMPWPESSFRFELTENNCSRCWVAEAKDEDGQEKLAGMAVLWQIVDELHVATFAVNPEFRRHKIGERLMAKALLDGFSGGANKAFLEVRCGNLAARNLYNKFGFTEEGIRKGYYQDNGEDAILMNLESPDLKGLESFL
jgi:ribosomal-protein-alanine N-acetyltransferase